MPTATFPITGMTCSSCVQRVDKALSAVPGVTAVQVDLAREQVRVSHVGIAPAVLAAAVEAKGYHLVLTANGEEHAATWVEPVRLAVVWAMAVPLLLPMLGVPLHLDWRLQAALAAVAVFGCGYGFVVRAARLAVQAESSMDTLVALGMLAAFAAGIVEGLGGAHHTSFEIAASLPAFVLLGKFIEARAKHRATEGLNALLELAPAHAVRLGADGSEQDLPVSELAVGDRVRVRPGSAIPVDGTISEGTAEVVEALLTGEPLPVAKHPGDTVRAGAVVHGSSLTITVQAAGAATWLARLADQVAAAAASRAPVQALADRIASWFVPVVLVIASATLFIWWLVTGDLSLAWRPAVTVLVIACPCALGLATPVAVATALGTAARQGLVVRDLAAFERLALATDLVLDKTGTLTEGRPMLRSVTPHTISESDARRLAAALEHDAAHPLAVALRASWTGMLPRVSDWRSHPGGGVSGVIDGRPLRLGSAVFLGLDLGDIATDASAVGLADDTRLLATFAIADLARPEMPAVLAELAGAGLRLHLLSGDRPAAVAAFAQGLPLASAEGGVDPAGKAQRVAALQAAGGVVAFAGDGVNDAVALASADAGISLPGLDATAASAPLNLHRPGLLALRDAYGLARRLRANVRQNLAWAFAYNVVLIPLAAGGLLEALGGPLLAGAAMGLSSITVVLNALRLRR